MTPARYEIAIIGGGLQGTALARMLGASFPGSSNTLAVIDPHETACAEWLRNTRATGMRYLRSPSSHNLDGSFHALRRFASERGFGPSHFLEPYARPSLSLFNQHTQHVIEEHRLSSLRVRGWVERITPLGDGYRIETDRNRCETRHLLLALGAEEALTIPEPLMGVPGAHHVFSRAFTPEEFRRARRPLIVGGGISAIQLAAESIESGGAPRIISPHPIRISQFDSDACFIGPRCLEGFVSVTQPAERGDMITESRYPGSVPHELAESAHRLIASGALEYLVGTVTQAKTSGVGYLATISTKPDGGSREITGDAIIAATGFRSVPRPDGLIARIASDLDLPTDASGRPVVDRALRWRRSDHAVVPGGEIFVTGRAAELEIGPAAPNLIGAYLAARRIVPYLAGTPVESIVPWRPIATQLN